MGAAGGLLIVWNEQVLKGHLYHCNEFALTIQFTSAHTGKIWSLSNVYGPCQQQERTIFLDWFRDFQVTDCPNWPVTGDFNYIRYPQDRNRDGGNISNMLAFNEAISNQALIEIPLKGRKFTSSNMQGCSPT